MTNMKLPKSLEREPLLDALCEIRFEGSGPLPDILPGIIFREYDGILSLQRLPLAEVPLPMRASDPRLQFAPIQEINFPKYKILIGDRSVAIRCNLPYPKWLNFKKDILSTTEFLHKFSNIIGGAVNRFSIKYVNLIESTTLTDQISKINLEIKLGSSSVSDNHINMQVYQNDGDILHIISVITGANGNLTDGRNVDGIVVDIDSIMNASSEKVHDLHCWIEENIENLKQSNKKLFFEFLKPATLNDMGPDYE